MDLPWECEQFQNLRHSEVELQQQLKPDCLKGWQHSLWPTGSDYLPLVWYVHSGRQSNCSPVMPHFHPAHADRKWLATGSPCCRGRGSLSAPCVL